MENLKYHLWLSSLPGIGCRTARRLLDEFNSPEGIFLAEEDMLKKAGCLTDRQLHTLLDTREKTDPDALYEHMLSLHVHCVPYDDSAFPAALRNIPDAPTALYVLGSLPTPDEFCLSMVGARGCTSHGAQTAELLARGLACSGVSIVSGMAHGIDSCSHRGCLEGGGKTYAILGCGPDICYPADEMELYMQIQESGGVISEFIPGTKPVSAHFPMRNRLIAALSRGTAVIEARERSGSLITADLALGYGRDVFAVPGRPDDALSAGCNCLIKNGAKPVCSAADILHEYDLEIRNTIPQTDLSGSGKAILGSIGLEDCSADDIAVKTGLPVEQVMAELTLLELTGRIRRIGKNRYMLEL